MKSYAIENHPATRMDFFEWLRENTQKPDLPITFWYRRALQRRLLKDLSDDSLTDIGLTRRQITQEASKYFWQN
jgi:uncharacterized protein YjiS (DUF1127 family)